MQKNKESNGYHSKYELISAKEIQVKKIPPTEWIVENFLIPGLTIIAGRPKVGKSFLCFNTFFREVVKVE